MAARSGGSSVFRVFAPLLLRLLSLLLQEMRPLSLPLAASSNFSLGQWKRKVGRRKRSTSVRKLIAKANSVREEISDFTLNSALGLVQVGSGAGGQIIIKVLSNRQRALLTGLEGQRTAEEQREEEEPLTRAFRAPPGETPLSRPPLQAQINHWRRWSRSRFTCSI